MIKTVCVCDICGKEMVKRGHTWGYEFKHHLLSNRDIKNKMDICEDCFKKFETYVKQQLKGNEE